MKASRFPHSLALIFGMIIIAQLLTYLIPAGEYQNAKDRVELEGDALRIALPAGRVSWARDMGGIFTAEGSTSLAPVPERMGEFAAIFSEAPGWQGEVGRLMISVNIPALQDGEHITFFIKEIALLADDRQNEKVHVLLKRITLLR